MLYKLHITIRKLDINVQSLITHSQLWSTEPRCAVRVHADDVLPRDVGRERDHALWGVHARQHHPVIAIANFHVHSNTRSWRHKPTRPGVIQLHLVVHWKHTLIITSSLSIKTLSAHFPIRCMELHSSPITVVSSGISSMKHFLSPSAMWKYKAEVKSKKRNKNKTDEILNISIFL